MIKQNCISKSFWVTKKNISIFEFLSNRRQMSKGHISRIHGILQKGNNPMGTLMVNEKNSKYRIIDGNHRIEALKKFFSLNKVPEDFKVELSLRIYKNLSSDEENKMYSEEATRRNESYEDHLQRYKDEIVFWKLIQDPLQQFPCKISIYKQKDSIRFRNILDALNTVKRIQRKGYVPDYLGKDELVEFANNLKFSDLETLKRFIRIFKSSFGDISEKNIFTRRQAFCPLFDIYYKNFKNNKEGQVVLKFSLLVGKPDLLMYLNMQGREAQQKVREVMLSYLNKGLSKHFII